MRQWNLPRPDLLITSLGSRIYYAHQSNRVIEDNSWLRHIDFRWNRDEILKTMEGFDGLRLLGHTHQEHFRISYALDAKHGPTVRQVNQELRQRDLHANVIVTLNRYMDLLPIRASKGQAIRYIAIKWGLPLERFFIVGDSGNDAEMLSGDTLGVVVGNHHKELDRLKGKPRIHFVQGNHAWGILEGLEYYNFLGDIKLPGDAEV